MSAFIDNNAIQSIFATTKPDGSYEGQFLAYFRSVGKSHPILLLAFAPKAAGTFFGQAAVEVLGGQLVRASHALGGRDCTPYLPNFLAHFLDSKAPPTIMHGHMQAFAANWNFLDMFGIKRVSMLRNIPDMLVSFWDMLDNDPTARADGLNCLIPDNFVTMDRDENANFMIDIVAP